MNLAKRYNGIYYIYFKLPNGTRKSISTKTHNKSEALTFLKNFDEEIKNRKTNSIPKISFEKYTEHFLQYSKNIHTLSTQKYYRLTIAYLKKFLGNILLSDISPFLMNQYFHNKLQTTSIFQARKDLIVAKSLLNKAVAEGYINDNPCKKIKQFRIPQKQPLFFAKEEFDKLINIIVERDFTDLVICAIYTGLRQMELITLEWSQVNLKDRTIILDNYSHLTKSKKVRTIPLTEKTYAVLERRSKMNNFRLSSNLVFTLNGRPFTSTTITHKFKKYIRSCDINQALRFHSLRHTFASWLVQKNVPIYQVSKLLGHSSIAVTQIYSHLRADDLRIAISSLDQENESE